jgi:hypothetical protein
MTFEATDVTVIDKLECSLDGEAISSCMNSIIKAKIVKRSP